MAAVLKLAVAAVTSVKVPDSKEPKTQLPGDAWWFIPLGYLRTGGKSVQLPCATSAAMPMLSPSVGCG